MCMWKTGDASRTCLAWLPTARLSEAKAYEGWLLSNRLVISNAYESQMSIITPRKSHRRPPTCRITDCDNHILMSCCTWRSQAPMFRRKGRNTRHAKKAEQRNEGHFSEGWGHELENITRFAPQFGDYITLVGSPPYHLTLPYHLPTLPPQHRLSLSAPHSPVSAAFPLSLQPPIAPWPLLTQEKPIKCRLQDKRRNSDEQRKGFFFLQERSFRATDLQSLMAAMSVVVMLRALKIMMKRLGANRGPNRASF